MRLRHAAALALLLGSRDAWAQADEAVEAIAAGRLKDLAALLDHGMDVNERGGTFRESLLGNAILLGRMDAVTFLVARGADVDARGAGAALTPLCRAATACNLPVVKLLVGKGAHVNQATGGELSTTPLLSSLSPAGAGADCYAVFRFLLDRGADARAARGAFDDQVGHGAIILATFRGDSRYARDLLRAGADPNSASAGQGALAYAIERLAPTGAFDRARDAPRAEEGLKVVELLVAAGACVDATSKDGLPLPQLAAKRLAIPDDDPDGAKRAFYGDVGKRLQRLLAGRPTPRK